jgi:hypothetical protein
MLILVAYIIHASYWLKISDALGNPAKLSNNASAYSRIQILQLHTSRFNDAFATILTPTKDLGSVMIIISMFVLLRYRSALSPGSTSLVIFVASTMIFVLFALFCPAGWVWKQSVKTILHLRKTNRIEYRRHLAMRPFGIMIGSFCVVKEHTYISVYNIILTETGNIIIIIISLFDMPVG